jgi:hypothetical protein
MSRATSIQKRANQGGHAYDAGNGQPGSLKRGQIGAFQRALDATLKRRGLERKKFTSPRPSPQSGEGEGTRR